MSSAIGNSQSKRRRVSGVLAQSKRGLSILTDAGEFWVLDRDSVDPDFIGQRVTAEGSLAGYDRLSVDWIGSA